MLSAQNAPLPVGVVLLAAGASVRMGLPKLLLPWGQTSVLGHGIAQWRTLGAAQVAVVCAVGDTRLSAELNRLGVPVHERIVNRVPEEGMFGSIKAAARWTGWMESLPRWAIVLGDQPHLSLGMLRQVLSFAAAHPDRVCQPSRHGRGRHPVVLPKAAFLALADAQEESLKQFLERFVPDIARCEIDDPALDLDLDTPADYAAMLAQYPPVKQPI